MKKVFLSLFAIAAIATASAQTSVGVKAGGQFTNFAGSDKPEGAKMKVGFYGGAYARFHVSENIAIQPEAVYSVQGAKFKEDGVTANWNSNYINVPVLFQYHLEQGQGLYFETGPQIGFLMSAKIKVDGEKLDVKDGMKSTDFSWAIGAGYKITEALGVNARYNLGLSKIGEGDGKVKNSAIQVGLSYALFNTGKK